jgi:hypothetical protein
VRFKAVLDAAKSVFFVPTGKGNVVPLWSFRNTVTVPDMLIGPLKMLCQYLKKLQEKAYHVTVSTVAS